MVQLFGLYLFLWQPIKVRQLVDLADRNFEQSWEEALVCVILLSRQGLKNEAPTQCGFAIKII